MTAEVVKNAVDTALEKFGPIASGIFAACVDEGSQMVKSMRSCLVTVPMSPQFFT